MRNLLTAPSARSAKLVAPLGGALLLFAATAAWAGTPLGTATSTYRPHSYNPSEKATASKSFSGGWNYTTPDLGPGVASTDIFGIEIGGGWDTYLHTSGGASATFSANARGGGIGFNYRATGTTSLSDLGGKKYQIDVSSTNTGTPTFTMLGPTASASFSAGLSLNNNIYGKGCLIGCGSFNQDLGSFSTNFTVLGYNTDNGGTLNIFGQSLSGVTKSLTLGNTSLTFSTPGNFTGTDGSSTSTLLTGVVDLGHIVESLAGLPPLSGGFDLPIVGGLDYNLVSMTSGVKVDLTRYGNLGLHVERSTDFLNPDGSYASVPMEYTTTEFGATHGAYTMPGSSVAFSCDAIFGPQIPLDLSSPIAAQCFTTHEVTRPTLASSLGNAQGSFVIGDGVTDLSGIQIVTRTAYSLNFDYNEYLSLSADYDVSALGGSIFGQGFGPLVEIDPSFSLPNFNLLNGSYDDLQTTYERLTIPGANAGVPEPGVWALMLLGAASVGAALRRRRRVAFAT